MGREPGPAPSAASGWMSDLPELGLSAGHGRQLVPRRCPAQLDEGRNGCTASAVFQSVWNSREFSVDSYLCEETGTRDGGRREPDPCLSYFVCFHKKNVSTYH